MDITTAVGIIVSIILIIEVSHAVMAYNRMQRNKLSELEKLRRHNDQWRAGKR